MDNPFKKLVEPPKKAPEELKTKVMKEVALLKLISDTMNLFFIKSGEAGSSVFREKKKNTNEKH